MQIDQRVQRVHVRLRCKRLLPDGIQCIRPGRGDTSPVERRLVHLDSRAIALDRLFDRFAAQRDQPLLPRITEHHGVSRQRIAEDALRQRAGIHGMERCAVAPAADPVMHQPDRQCGVPVADHIRRGRFRQVEDGGGAARCQPGQRVDRRGHHQVGAQQQVGLAFADARRRDLEVGHGDTHLADDGAVLLRHAGKVEHRSRQVIEACRRAEQGAHRQDAGAADAGDVDIERLL
ncbi:hypothetical protein D3C72_1332570 [compost metagenome]